MISWIDAADFSGAEGTAGKNKIDEINGNAELRKYRTTEIQSKRKCVKKTNALKKRLHFVEDYSIL